MNRPLQFLAASVIAILSTSLIAPAQAQAAPQDVPKSFTYHGAGWGHGVGMSQYGAYGQALEGRSAKQILEHYYKPAKLTNTSSYANSDIRVQLVSGITTTTLTPKDGKMRLKFGKHNVSTSQPVTFTTNGSRIDMTINGKKYTTSTKAGVTVEWQNTRYWNSGTKNTVISIPRTNDGVGTGTFRHGKIDIKLLNKKLNVVNSLRVNDEYLYGLAEMPSSWHLEALKTQAIAGRTYALHHIRSVKSACDCHVYDEVKSQKFTGWAKEYEGRNGAIGQRWKTAVDATQTKRSGRTVNAQVMTYNGKLIEALYSSTTGGKTRNSESVWGNKVPYLRSRDDRWALKPEVRNPNASWAYTITQTKAASAYKLPNVQSISIKKAADGTLVSSTAKSTTGKTSTLGYSQTRSLFGAKSVWATKISGNGSVKPATTTPAPKSSTAPATNITNTTKSVPYVTTSAVNMRAGAGTTHKVLRVAKKNEQVVTTGKQTPGWLQVKSGTTTGWISKSYLKKYVAPKAAPKKTVTKAKTAPKKTAAPKKVTAPKTTRYTTSTSLNIRSKASASSARLGTFKKGAAVQVQSISKGWAKIQYKNRTAYVAASYLKKPVVKKASSSKTTTVKSSTKRATVNVHMRSGAGVKNRSLAVIPKNTRVTVTGKQQSGWIQVKYKGKTGWTAGSYLK